MSFITKMRRVLGLDDSIDGEAQYLDDETSVIEAPAEPAEAHSQPLPSESKADDPSVAAAPQPGEAESIAADMLAEVVAIFNAFQPEFIARSLDPAKQEALLTEKMTPTLKSRLEAIASARREQVESEARAERDNLDADLKRMRDRNAELERRRTEFMNEQLSAKRQKRALKERISDLEAQVAQLAADKDQLELENHSLTNKLRIASVTSVSDAGASSEADKEVAEKLAKAEAALAEAESKARDAAERLATLEQDNDAMSKAVESLKERCKVADEMISNFRKRLSEAESRASDAEKKVEDAAAEEHRKEQLAKAANSEVDRLRAQVDALRKELDRSAEIADDLAKKDARINELKARLRDAAKVEETIELLQKENRSLKDTIEANLYEHAAQVSSLRRELEEHNKPRRGRPRKEASAPKEENQEAEKPPKRKSPAISAIDELIEGCEWMKAPSADELKAAPPVTEPSEDFGYRPPVKKPQQPDDAGQLTLF